MLRLVILVVCCTFPTRKVTWCWVTWLKVGPWIPLTCRHLLFANSSASVSKKGSITRKKTCVVYRCDGLFLFLLCWKRCHVLEKENPDYITHCVRYVALQITDRRFLLFFRRLGFSLSIMTSSAEREWPDPMMCVCLRCIWRAPMSARVAYTHNTRLRCEVIFSTLTHRVTLYDFKREPRGKSSWVQTGTHLWLSPVYWCNADVRAARKSCVFSAKSFLHGFIGFGWKNTFAEIRGLGIKSIHPVQN